MSAYKFKRDFYDDVERAVKESSVTFLLGPRQCGKTVCMKQIADAFPDAVYVDSREDLRTRDEKKDFIKKVITDISNNEKILYLIDETTYLHRPDSAIAEVHSAFSMTKNTNTRIVFSSCHSNALDFWGRSAFAGNAVFIRPDFLSYPEWLSYKGLSEVSAMTYEMFLQQIREFYPHFTNTKSYLQGCLDEAANSNRNGYDATWENDCSLLDVETLFDLMSTALISYHNCLAPYAPEHKNFCSEDRVNAFIENFLNISQKYTASPIFAVIQKRACCFKAMDHECMKQALQFLVQCGLITVNYLSNDPQDAPYDCKTLLRYIEAKDVFPNISDFSSRFYISINHPMFYVDLIRELLEKERYAITPAMLDSIVENHMRGLVSDKCSLEYVDSNGKMIDYISHRYRIAIHVAIADSAQKDAAFEVLPDGYRKILITGDECSTSGGIEKKPYYRFIYEQSGKKDFGD